MILDSLKLDGKVAIITGAGRAAGFVTGESIAVDGGLRARV